MEIHSSAIISKSANIGEGAFIGPFAIIEADVVLGKNCHIAAHAILRKGSILGDAVEVDSFSVVGATPQLLDLDRSIESGVKIGDGTILREGCTVNRSSIAGGYTVVGDHCYLMAQTNVGHDCKLGSSVVMANNVMIGGFVTIGDKCFFGGGAGIHQNCRIGTYAMVAGNATIAMDVPPYTMVTERNEAHGLNLVGLKRGAFDQREIADLKRCYRAVYLGGGNLKNKAAQAAREHEFGITNVGARFLSFFESGKRGFVESVPSADN